MLLASSWFAVDPPPLTGLTALKVGAVVILTFFVRRYHKPWPATALLAVMLLILDSRAHRTPVYLMLHGLIYLAVGGGLFWAIDRSNHLVLTIGLAVGGMAVLLYLL